MLFRKHIHLVYWQLKSCCAITVIHKQSSFDEKSFLFILYSCIYIGKVFLAKTSVIPCRDNALLIALASFGDGTLTVLFLFILLCPRWPRQLVGCICGKESQMYLLGSFCQCKWALKSFLEKTLVILCRTNTLPNCLGPLWRWDTNSFISFYIALPKVAKATSGVYLQ